MTNEEMDKLAEEIEKKLNKALEEERLAQTNALIPARIETPLLVLMVGSWIAGAAMAGDGWHFVAAVCLPVYAWVIVAVKFLGILGVV